MNILVQLVPILLHCCCKPCCYEICFCLPFNFPLGCMLSQNLGIYHHFNPFFFFIPFLTFVDFFYCFFHDGLLSRDYWILIKVISHKIGSSLPKVLNQTWFFLQQMQEWQQVGKRPSLGIGFVEFKVFVNTRKNLVHSNLGHCD